MIATRAVSTAAHFTLCNREWVTSPTPDFIADSLLLLRNAKTPNARALGTLNAVSLGPLAAPQVAALVAELRDAISVTQTCHLELAHMLPRIERRQKAIDGMRYEHPVYWRQASSGAKEGPYCAHCWDHSHAASPLANLPFRGHDRWVCRTCGKTFFSAGAAAAMAAAGLSARQQGRDADGGVIVDD